VVGSGLLGSIPARNILVGPLGVYWIWTILTDRLIITLKGFLHGAYFSGVRAADEILNLVRGRRGK